MHALPHRGIIGLIYCDRPCCLLLLLLLAAPHANPDSSTQQPFNQVPASSSEGPHLIHRPSKTAALVISQHTSNTVPTSGSAGESALLESTLNLAHTYCNIIVIVSTIHPSRYNCSPYQLATNPSVARLA